MANCGNCGAPMQRDAVTRSLVCTHCGSSEEVPPLIRDIEIDEASDVSCPSCGVPLAKARLFENPLLVCRQCHGMLVEMIYFVSIIRAASALEDQHGIVLPRQQNPGDRTITCPVCHKAMLSHIYGGPGNLVLDTCETCQVNWLDSGELRRIARAR